jgi:sarcosine oxidase
MMYDALVVGKGLFGVAAARALGLAGARVAIVGPDEPVHAATHEGPFASHYDEGRVTRRLAQDVVWSRLAALAIDEYRALEAASGVRFYEPTGLWNVLPAGERVAAYAAVGRQLNVPFVALSGDALARRSDLFRFPADAVALVEDAPAGHINPRALIRAGLTILGGLGATIVRETVVRVQRQGRDFTVHTAQGSALRASQVLVAAGAFSNVYDLLPEPLALRAKTETILLARLSQAEAARLERMPAVLYDIDSPVLDGIYLLPPLRYPDGGVYLKLGCNTTADRWPESLSEMRAWFVGGESDVTLSAMREALHSFMPGLTLASAHTGRCIVCYTRHGRPYIDEVDDGLFVAVGGNGHGAKSSLAIGRLAAARLGSGEWPAVFEPGLFAVAP